MSSFNNKYVFYIITHVSTKKPLINYDLNIPRYVFRFKTDKKLKNCNHKPFTHRLISTI